MLGTPGGDFSELVMGLDIYFNMNQIKPTIENIIPIMKKYIEDIASADRKFYYHTSKNFF